MQLALLLKAVTANYNCFYVRKKSKVIVVNWSVSLF